MTSKKHLPIQHVVEEEDEIIDSSDMDTEEAGERWIPADGIYRDWEARSEEMKNSRRNTGIAAAVLAAGGIVAFAFSLYIFGALLIISSAVIGMQLLERPRRHRIVISAHGITENDRLHHFRNIKSFWIAYNPPYQKEIVCTTSHTLNPIIRIPLGDEHPVPVRQILLEFLPEVEHEESLIDLAARRLGL
jgi:hypothetical protein